MLRTKTRKATGDIHIFYTIIYDIYGKETIRTLTVELESIDRMLIQIELTVMAGDQESYNMSAKSKSQTKRLITEQRCVGLNP